MCAQAWGPRRAADTFFLRHTLAGKGGASGGQPPARAVLHARQRAHMSLGRGPVGSCSCCRRLRMREIAFEVGDLLEREMRACERALMRDPAYRVETVRSRSYAVSGDPR